MNRKILILMLAVLAAAFWLTATPASATTCPAIGFASDCNLLITINPGPTVVTSFPAVAAYDGVEDQLVGVTNNLGVTITSLALSGASIFGFDGDGAGEPGAGCVSNVGPPFPCFPGGPFGPTGYEGPGTSFTITDSSNGIVNFIGGLAPGKSIWFSLEGARFPRVPHDHHDPHA